MTEESITKKLSELFELHKSGAITKDEFDKLKKQILSEDGVKNIETVTTDKKQERETVHTQNLLDDEKLIKAFDLEVGFAEDPTKNNALFGTWYPVNLTFTSKKIMYQSKLEHLSFSYENVAGLQILNNKIRPRFKKLILPILGIITLTVIGIITKVEFLIYLFLGAAAVNTGYLIFFLWVKTYQVSLVAQNSGLLCAFDIKRNDELINEIKKAYETGKHS
jgi:hypothetical protein